LEVEDLCVRLSEAGFDESEIAAAVLLHIERQQGKGISLNELAEILWRTGVVQIPPDLSGNLIYFQLRARNEVACDSDICRVKPLFRKFLNEKYAKFLEPAPAPVNHDHGLLPKAAWQNTPDYVEAIAKQINGCYQSSYYDGASVLVRRLIETLLIKCYEKLGLQQHIQNQDEYKSLDKIISDVTGQNRLDLTRETKNYLKRAKLFGDRSAHNPYYLASKTDLDEDKDGLRVAIPELIAKSQLRFPSTT
jgi:hypothetical protein